MDKNVLDIQFFDGIGYKPLIDFNDWRVAILRYIDELQPDRIEQMERHVETDEVFVLLQGRGTLLLGGNGPALDGVHPQPMEPGKLYNVKRNAWHSVLLSKDASVLLVENRDTARENSEYAQLTADQRKIVVEIAQREGYE
jgi:mannose-6-phosphate isomerase-like protein (cupin superfamily)